MSKTRQTPTSSGKRQQWRSPWAWGLIAAALLVSLVLGGSFLVVGRLHSSADSFDHPAQPLTDDQTKSQVVESAKQIVSITHLQNTTAGYLLMSCTNLEDPPYQGAIYLNFALPADTRVDADFRAYFRAIAADLVAHGWSEGLPPNQYLLGEAFHKDGVTAIVYRDRNYQDLGTMRLYGQCRNMTDHRHDTTAWIDISEQFTPTR